MRGTTFAIADAKTPTKVSLWCRGNKDGFHVINGNWQGQLAPDGFIYVGHDKQPTGGRCVIVWIGTVPDHCVGYNEAIAWINSELRK